MLSLAKVTLTMLGKQGKESGQFARGCDFSQAGWGQRTPVWVGWKQRIPAPGTLAATVPSALWHCPHTGAQAADGTAGIKARLRDSGGVQFSEALLLVEVDAHTANPYSDF